MIGGLDAFRQIEPKYPTFLFKKQLTAYVEKIYERIPDNLKEHLLPLFGFCFHKVSGLIPVLARKFSHQKM